MGGAGEWRKYEIAERIEQFHRDISAVVDTGGQGHPAVFLEQYQRLVEEAESILGQESPVVKLRWSGTENLVAAQVMSTLRMLSGQLARWFSREADLTRGER